MSDSLSRLPSTDDAVDEPSRLPSPTPPPVVGACMQLVRGGRKVRVEVNRKFNVIKRALRAHERFHGRARVCVCVCMCVCADCACVRSLARVRVR